MSSSDAYTYAYANVGLVGESDSSYVYAYANVGLQATHSQEGSSYFVANIGAGANHSREALNHFLANITLPEAIEAGLLTADDFSEDGALPGKMTKANGHRPELTWEASAGTWLVSDGVVTHSGPGDDFAFVDVQQYDMDVRLKIQLQTSGFLGVVARMVDPNNLVMSDVAANGTQRAYKRVGGSWSDLGAIEGTVSSGDEIGIRIIGTSVELLRNGAVVDTATVADSVLQTGTKAGLRAGGTHNGSGSLDDFRVGVAGDFTPAVSGGGAGLWRRIGPRRLHAGYSRFFTRQSSRRYY